MWIRHTDGTYSNTDVPKSNAQIIQTGDEFNIYIGLSGSPVQRGYPSKEDAQLALDEFMKSELGAKDIQPPTTAEESEEEGQQK